MSHSVTVSVTDGGKKTKVVNAQEMTVREKILTRLFGKKAKVLVITPYSATNEITIKDQSGFSSKPNRGVQFDCN